MGQALHEGRSAVAHAHDADPNGFSLHWLVPSPFRDPIGRSKRKDLQSSRFREMAKYPSDQGSKRTIYVLVSNFEH
jgi:hypothetical protein